MVEHVHREGEVCRTLRGQHSSRRIAWVVDQDRVVLTFPLQRVRGIGDNRIERRIIQMLGL